MDDLIKRADAVKTVIRKCSPICDWQVGTQQYPDCVVAEINALPSADAVHIHNDGTLEVKVPNAQKVGRVLVMDTDSNIGGGLFYPDDAVQGEWIPCSERLPIKSGDYLCTIPLDEVDTYTEVLTFHKGRFYEDDDEWGTTYHDDVLAWQPLPKPYKGGDDE